MRDPEFQDNLDLPTSTETRREIRHRGNVWKVLSRVMEVVLYILIVLAVAKLFWPEIDRQKALDSELNRLNAIKQDKETQVSRLRQEHRLLKDDQEYLESVSRDRLNLQKEDEVIIRLERD